MRSSFSQETPLIGIADDDRAVGESISGLIRSAGFRTVVFLSAEAFLESGLTQEAKCLILDIKMPQMNGLDLQKRLMEMACRIPINFATACAADDLKKDALDHGAVAFLRKPFGDNALFTAMKLALKS